MNDLEQFNDAALILFKDIAETTKLKKKYEEKEKETKAELEKLMTEFNIKSIDNQFIKITNVAGSVSKTVDLKTFKEKEPTEYEALIEDYPKVTTRNPYLKYTVK